MRLITLSLCITLLAACTGSTPSASYRPANMTSENESAAVDKVYARWRTAVETADIPGYVSALHPNVRMLPPGAPVVEGSDSYAAFLEPVFAAADYKIEVIQMPQIEFVGELAIAEYEYVIHLALKDQTSGVSEPGALTDSRTRARYFDILRKTDAGTWGIWRHPWRPMPD